MSKPQSATEPSMEDILASIRKMISEERIGPRPVPDQMSRTSFGEAAAPKADEDRGAPTSEPQRGLQPLPEAQPELQSPMQLEPQMKPEPAPDAPQTQEARATVPSFSSLSDALKAAAKPSPQHRSLDEKIADMLDKGPAPAAPAQPVTVDPLAVFAASRTARQAPGTNDPARTPPRSEAQMPKTQKPGGEETRSEPAGGASARLNGAVPKPAELPSTVVPLTGDSSAGRRDMSSPRFPGAPETTADKAGSAAAPAEKKPEDKTVISIPPRGTGAQTGATAKSGGLNGGTVSPFGPRPLPGSSGVPRAEETGPFGGGKAPLQPSLEDIAKATRSSAAVPSGDAAAPSKPGASFNFLGDAPPAEEATAKPKSAEPFKIPGLSGVDDLVAKIAATHAAEAAARISGERRDPTSKAPGGKSGLTGPEVAKSYSAKSDSAKSEGGTFEPVKSGAPAPKRGDDASKNPAGGSAEAQQVKGGPSEALLDAVVDMVHAEPSSLSVFTSGSAFISGVGEHHDAPGVGGAPDQPKDPRKLDRAASELLRPMLRQWLAENMPRIVEEALRSELDSSQPPDPDTKKS